MGNQLDIFGNTETPVYYNTTRLKGEELAAEQDNASTQEMQVIRFFNERPGLHTPWDVLEGTGMHCINSVRRAMTNLTEKGRLEKTDIKKEGGPYNKKSYTWKLMLTLF